MDLEGGYIGISYIKNQGNSEVLLLSYPYSTYPGVSLRTLYLSLVVQANIVCLENGVTIPIFEYSTVVPTRHVPCVMIKTVVCDWILT